jgi:hypothetical protein
MSRITPEGWLKLFVVALALMTIAAITMFVHLGKAVQDVCEGSHFFEIHGKTYYCERVPQELDT